MIMCVEPFKQEQRKCDFSFRLMDNAEKNIFRENIEKISESIVKGEKIICKLFHKKDPKKK